MAFPQTPVPLKTELLIDGTWTDVSADVRMDAGAVRIERGRRDVQGAASPTTAQFQLDNRTGTYTDDNPLSPYFNLLPLYMQTRISLTGITDSYVYMPGVGLGGNYVVTADKAALDVTGDIDLRAEIEPFTWNAPIKPGQTGGILIIASKVGNTTDQFSWYWGLNNAGKLQFFWSTTGTYAGLISSTSSVALPGTPDRLAVRVVMDVDTGGGNRNIKFYTSDSIDGTWTLLDSLTYAGTTSIFSGFGDLEIGSADSGSTAFSVDYTWAGKVYAFRMYNSAGTLVANADFRSQTLGATSFADGLGNTWTMTGQTFITNDGVRFWGETESLPQEWDNSSRDNYSRVSSFDALRRISTDQSQLQSPLYQTILQWNPTLYLPGEDGANSTVLSSAAEGAESPQTENVRFQAATDLAGSDGAWQMMSTSTYVRALARDDPATAQCNAVWHCKIPSLPASDTRLMYLFNTDGVVRRWFIYVGPTGFKVEGVIPQGGGFVITTGTAVFGGTTDPANWLGMNFRLVDNFDGTFTWRLTWFEVGKENTEGFFFIEDTTNDSGKLDAMIFQGQTDLTDVYFAHSFITNDANYDFVTTDQSFASRGFSGELAGTRYVRLCDTAGLPYELDGWRHLTQAMGAQRVTTLAESLQECADADGGLLLGSRRRLGVLLVTQECIAQRGNLADLSHSASELSSPPKPIKDSYGRRNDITVYRQNGGGNSRRVVTDGKLGTSTIGVVPGSATVNVETDEDLAPVAAFLAALGTWDERRIDNISVGLHRSQTLLSSTKGKALLALDPGRYVTITNFPSHQAPGPSEQLVQGYVETISNFLYDIVATGFPYGPWRTGIIDGLIRGLRFAATDTTVGTAMNTTTTTLMLDTSGTDPLWCTTALDASMTFNFDILVGGERMTVTNITGGSSPQTATVTRSVNGVVKSHAAGTLVQLFYVTTFGR